MLADANGLWGFLFSFILQNSVSEVARPEGPAWCAFSHLLKIDAAAFEDVADFSFGKQPC